MGRSTQAAYRLFATSISATAASTRILMDLSPAIPLSLRKVLLAWARVQSEPKPGTRIYERYREQWNEIVHYNSHAIFRTRPGHYNAHFTILDIAKEFGDTIGDPFVAGFVSVVLRTTPSLDTFEAEEDLRKQIEKELDASQSLYRPTDYNFSSFFSWQNRKDPITPRMNSNVEMSEFIRTSYLELRTLWSLQPPILFPKTNANRKHGPVDYEGIRHDLDFEPTDSYLDLERIYSQTGIELGGDTQMRTAWKYNELKPRVYYAQGGRAYHASKHIHRIVNSIVDMFLTTHRMRRFDPLEAMLVDDETLVIYDYSSFTSNMDMLADYIDSLADFFRGTDIQIVDTHEGLLTIDLGEYLARYNQECNRSPQFDVSRVLAIPYTLMCHTTGMLGVPGNIGFCTALHGQHLMMLTSRGHCKVVGDDAKFKYEMGDGGEHWEYVMTNLESFGELAADKVEQWGYSDDYSDLETERWKFLKRPQGRFQNREIVGKLVTWPNLALAFGYDNQPLRTPSNLDDLEKLVSSLYQFTRMLDMAASLRFSLSDLSRRMICRFQRVLYTRIAHVTGHGWAKVAGGRFLYIKDRNVFVPRLLDEEDIGSDWRASTIDGMSYDTILTLPAPATETWISTYSDLEYLEGATFEGVVTRGRALMTKLEFLERKPVYRKFQFRDLCYEDQLELINGRYPHLYRFTVIREVPVSLRPILLL